jgi:hypothetical protein
MAWASGLLTYLGALFLTYHQRISVFDLIGTVQVSIVGFAVTYGFSITAILFLRRIIPGAILSWLFPVISISLAFLSIVFVWLLIGVPAFLAGAQNALELRFFISPETGLYYWMFGASGLVVGFGLPIISRRAMSA